MAQWITELILICFLTPLFATTANQALDRLKLRKLKGEIENLRGNANKIINYLTEGPGKHQVYDRLATFVDTFGSRIAGSANLEHAIDYMLEELQQDQLDNVHGEEVTVPHWVRGKESARMILPRNYPIALLGLGSSVGTTPDGITAEVLVVQSFDELQERAAEVFSFLDSCIERKSVTSHYHGSKVSGSQQSFLTETAICIVERWKKSMGYRFVPECNHGQEQSRTCQFFRFFFCHICRTTVR